MRFTRGVRAYRDGSFFMEWGSSREAAEWLRRHGKPKADRARVYGAASGLRKSAYGFTWELVGEGKREYGSAKDDDARLYRIWADMKAHVYDPSDGSYKHEGGAGIRVCDEWQGYDGFRAWAEEHGYSEGKVLMRRDLAGDYEPGNCSWDEPLLGSGYAAAHRRLPVIRRDKDGRVTRYGSETEAAIALVAEGNGNRNGNVKMTASNIWVCLKRKTSKAYGSAWWFEGDEDAPDPGKGFDARA